MEEPQRTFDEPIEFESPACMLCAGTSSVASDTIEWREGPLHYRICMGCGLKFMCPRPTAGWYARFYESAFWQEKVTWTGWSSHGPRRAVDIDEGTRKRVAKQRWRARRIHNRLLPWVPLDESSLVVDVGTAFGETPALLRDRHGCRVLGVEPSIPAREYCREVNGVELLASSMEELADAHQLDGQVDVLIMSNVLENIVDARQALASTRRLLRPDGWLYVEVCNFYFNNAVNPYHPYVFSPETLSDLLAREGFRLVTQYSETHPRQAQLPTDPFLCMVARPGPPMRLDRAVDVGRMLADQELGLARIAEGRAHARALKSARADAASGTPLPFAGPASAS